MKFVKDKMVFSTGNSRYACSDTLGISSEGMVHYGSDGCFYDPYDGSGDGALEQKLTPAELTELADHMIERWQTFKQQIVEAKSTSLNDDSSDLQQ
jgi:hypothetical protein